MGWTAPGATARSKASIRAAGCGTCCRRAAIGCIVYPAAEVIEPGVIEHTYGNRFTLGEPDGSHSARVEALSQAADRGRLKAPVRTNIRDEIWVKLWGNLAFNPLSALTGSTLDRLAFRPDLRARGARHDGGSAAVAEALGVRFAVSIDKRIDGAGEVGVHKTSMLQDLERGRPMEIDALLGAVVELGRCWTSRCRCAGRSWGWCGSVRVRRGATEAVTARLRGTRGGEVG